MRTTCPAPPEWKSAISELPVCQIWTHCAVIAGKLRNVRYEEAVLGVLGGSVVSALLGYAWLRAVLPDRATG